VFLFYNSLAKSLLEWAEMAEKANTDFLGDFLLQLSCECLLEWAEMAEKANTDFWMIFV